MGGEGRCGSSPDPWRHDPAPVSGQDEGSEGRDGVRDWGGVSCRLESLYDYQDSRYRGLGGQRRDSSSGRGVRTTSFKTPRDRTCGRTRADGSETCTPRKEDLVGVTEESEGTGRSRKIQEYPRHQEGTNRGGSDQGMRQEVTGSRGQKLLH